MPAAVMIFAAGFGTRMKHLTRDVPKPMIPVAGLPLIDHAIALAKDLPATRIVANLHYKANVLEQHLTDTGVLTITEHPDILDTGGGLRNALSLLGPHPVITLNSDAIWKGPNPLSALMKAWNPDTMDGLLMTLPPARTLGHDSAGDFSRDANGRVKRGPGWVYGGAQILKTHRLEEISEERFSLNRIWDMMIADNSLYAIEYDGLWCDVGHPGGIKIAEDMLRMPDV